MEYTASACGKTILFGEHAVVYGEPAIAIPLADIRTFVKLSPNGQEFRIVSKNTGSDILFKDLSSDSGLYELFHLLMEIFSFSVLPADTLIIDSEIPVASGLGSGAALSVAIIRAFIDYYKKPLSVEQINDIAYKVEKVYHGSPSGIDNTTISYEQPVIFTKNSGFRNLRADLDQFNFLVVDSGIRSRTIDVVNDVRKNFEQNRSYFNEIGSLVKTAVEALESGCRDEIGELMNENHRLLCKIDVSCPKLNELIEEGLSQGALGGKLTGAGRGGNFLILAKDPEQAERLKQLYVNLGVRVIL